MGPGINAVKGANTMKRMLGLSALALALASCATPATDPVATLVATYTAADSAAVAFLSANTNAETKVAVKACEQAGYAILEPIKTTWLNNQAIAPGVLANGQTMLATMQACLTANGVKI